MGLWFSEHVDLDYMASQVAAAAHQALGLLIAKTKCIPMNFKCYTKLYDSLVQPVIDYGACVWGHLEFKCIEAVQNRATWYFLGVPSKTPTTAVLGEMGWEPQTVKQWVCVTRQWCRFSVMDDSRINKHVFKWAVNSKYKNWVFKCKSKFESCGLEYIANIDQQLSPKHTVRDARKCLMDNFIEASWREDLNRITAKHGPGLNKLRTYRLFKNDFKTEPYVERCYYSDRSAMARIRCGVAPLRVELGRYDHGEYIPEFQRVCQLCDQEIENEIHVLLQCPFYHDIHVDLFQKAADIFVDFRNYVDVEKLKLLMSDALFKYTARTCRDILNRRKDLLTV